MRRYQYGLALTAACTALLLTGCGGGPDAQPASGGAEQAAAPDTYARGAPEGGVAQDQAAPITEGEPARKRAPATSEQDRQGVASGVKVSQQDRQVIYVARMTVRAKEVTGATQRAKQLVTAVGGYLSKEESQSGDGGNGSATLEFKIPPARYAEVLASLGKDLGKQLSLSQGTEDVTLQVADVNSRLKSAQQALDSLRTLLKKADTIGAVLQVEREIAAREADVESLQAQQKELARQVGMATLTLTVVGPVAVVNTPPEEPPGFLGGLQAGWASLVAFGKVVLTVLGVVLPWLVVIVPVPVLAIHLVRRARARRPERPAPPDTPATPEPQAP
ncbi:DUF4349 domain-containing protein [Nonomuraea lactucae]|uniref:DUF4349 domain-containing protein n=1 Tax=Nonomuraea lactucae TaxID=2249762 RepID=UPI000DE1E683|nr:DUF4349 domain-containing protein [Nonomuraea lactucae]